ncbi:uncharacterized protein LOC108245605 [Kryptolebias marmoratus]|uniref:uncharacterized protein LOC108245605 n=1 Tax=Kryptolebias marmoratus TaxID=37003 RepID=UPI0007F93133|nr:uncharacterized protein LOC108245605 [Kryptolebias marmoratus]
MFAAETKAFVKNVGLEKTLISNSNLNEKMELLTLVKVSERNFWQCPKYQRIMLTLPDLMEEEFSPEISEEVLVKDFMTTAETSGTGKLGVREETVGEAEISANADTLDGLVEPVSIKKTNANLKKMRNKFSDRKINEGKLKLLKLKQKEKLMFVHETISNTGPVKLIRKSQYGGSMSASCQKMLNLLFKGSRKEETSFTIPEESTFAYGLWEIMLEGQKMEIPIEPWNPKRELFIDSSSPSKLQQVREGIQEKEHLLNPLAELPIPTRHDLLKKLQEVLEVPDGLALLEELLDQSSGKPNERPQSEAISSFMDLVVSKVSSTVKDSIYLLVCSMDCLLDEMVRPLTSCSPETVKVLSQMVDSLKQDMEVKLPESLPAALQEDGQLRWGAELLCSSDETLEALSDTWDRPSEVLLEALALAVLGLNVLQNST